MNDEYAGLDNVKIEIEYLADNYDIAIRKIGGIYRFSLKKGRIHKQLKKNDDEKDTILEAIDFINEDSKRLEQALKEMNLLLDEDTSCNWISRPIKVRKDNLLDANNLTLELLEALINSAIVHLDVLIKDKKAHKEAGLYTPILDRLEKIRYHLRETRGELSDYNDIDFYYNTAQTKDK